MSMSAYFANRSCPPPPQKGLIKIKIRIKRQSPETRMEWKVIRDFGYSTKYSTESQQGSTIDGPRPRLLVSLDFLLYFLRNKLTLRPKNSSPLIRNYFALTF